MQSYLVYSDGWKYRVEERIEFQTTLLGYRCSTAFSILQPNGILIALPGYAWDGPSGPTIDTKNSLPASLEHDMLYQFMRLGLLPHSCRATADQLLYERLVRDGMSRIRASIWLMAVRQFAAYPAEPRSLKPVKRAP